MSVKYIGRWPIDGKEIRKKPSNFYHIPRDKMLHTIFGEKYPVSMSFYVSNDLVHMGEIEIPPGGQGPRCTEVDWHNGDEVMFIEKGPITIFLPDTEETFVVEEGEAIFIPEKTKHIYINYIGKVVKGIFSIAPNL